MDEMGTLQLLTLDVDGGSIPLQGVATAATNDGFVVGEIPSKLPGDVESPFIWDSSQQHAMLFDDWLIANYGPDANELKESTSIEDILDIDSNGMTIDFALRLSDESLFVLSLPLDTPSPFDFNDDKEINVMDLMTSARPR